MTSRREGIYAFAGALSGALWWDLALLLDLANGAGQWTMPTHKPLELTAFLFCGVLTGLAVSYLFRGSFRRAQPPSELALPLMTLPVAIFLFGVLVWLARLALGYRFYEGQPATRDLELILTTYFFVAFVSVALPVLYVIALLNQGVMHLILVSGTERRNP